MLANGLHLYKFETSKVSEVVEEKWTMVNLPLQFVSLNNLKRIVRLSGICGASLLLSQNCQMSCKVLTELEFCCRAEGGCC